ncbi:M15 family metallopeptidase [Pseudomonas aeruginosa]|nr:M15 family metallopeptidase [Pseudomonas aeruginosa]
MITVTGVRKYLTRTRGLLILANYFNAAGWYWGAAFPTEDGMHFEVSRGLLAQWKKDGLI